MEYSKEDLMEAKKQKTGVVLGLQAHVEHDAMRLEIRQRPWNI